MPDDRPTFGSLFAGIGGIDLGLERAGWRGRWQVEIDPFCQRVLAKHWPDVRRYGDIKLIDWSGVERVDLLAGGFPCQPVSTAGRQAAQADERWLWPEFDRAIRALRPSLVLVENVTNLLAVNDGSAFGDILGDLAASGYDAEWDCVPASAVGAVHERDRVWLVAYAAARGRGGAAVADAECIGLPRPREPIEPLRPAAFADWQAGRPIDGGWWSIEPDVARVAHGLPAGLVGWNEAAVKALGNAVVPQVVEVIGRQLLAAMEGG